MILDLWRSVLEGINGMTLNKKILFWSFIGLFLMFISAAIVSFCIERYFYRQQLNNSAHDIAVTISFALSDPLHNNDKKQINNVVNNVFDQCVYYLLEVRGAQDELIISRTRKPQMNYAPQWFVTLIHWTTLVQAADIKYEGNAIGTICVSADTSYACDALWNGTVVLFGWFCFWLVVVLLGGYFFVRWLLEPLQRITKQARALAHRQFVLEAHLPSTTEFKKAALVMNQSVKKLKNQFQQQLEYMDLLRYQLFQDQLTGIGNRRYFLYQLTSLLYRDDSFVPGFIVGVAMDSLDNLKQQYGETQTRQFIKELATFCFEFWHNEPDMALARIEEGRFALIIRENDERVFIRKCEEFNQKLQKMILEIAHYTLSVAVISYQEYHEEKALLGVLEKAFLQAKTESNHLAVSENLVTHRQLSVTAKEVDNLLKQEVEYLNVQPVSNGQRILHQELSITIPVGDALQNSRYFMPMIRDAGLTRKLDTFVITHICEQDLLGLPSVAFTLSDETLNDERLLDGYLQQLSLLPRDYREHLSFEVDEWFVLKYFTRTVHVFNKVHQLGIQLGVRQVGIHYGVMSYLNELPIQYLKLHGSLSHALDSDKKFIVKYFCDMPNANELDIIATELQTEVEWNNMKALGVSWGQGAYFDALRNSTE